MAQYKVLVDANVFYSFYLRDIIIGLGQTGLFLPRWSNEIVDEWINALLAKRPDLNPKALARTRLLMSEAIPDAIVSDYEGLIEVLDLPDPHDRHVLAAAIKASADAIVTFNIKDFPKDVLERFQLECLHPDDFLIAQLDLEHALFLEILGERRKALSNPAFSAEDYINHLERLGLASLAARLRTLSALI